MLQRILSQDYQSLARANAASAWPAIALFGRSWSPASLTTWIVPVVLLASGAVAGWAARRRLHVLIERDEEQAHAQASVSAEQEGLA